LNEDLGTCFRGEEQEKVTGFPIFYNLLQGRREKGM
jgi:hypothetical protein